MPLKVKLYNCWFHYNKAYPEWGPLDKMLVHFNGEHITCANGLEVCVSTFEIRRETQPRAAMACLARKVYKDPNDIVWIL